MGRTAQVICSIVDRPLCSIPVKSRLNSRSGHWPNTNVRLGLGRQQDAKCIDLAILSNPQAVIGDIRISWEQNDDSFQESKNRKKSSF